MIREENPVDQARVHALNVGAFETEAEAKLVDALRERASPLVSLVAEDDRAIVGHILFSPVSLDGQEHLKIMGLAPMAVSPALQRKGIGFALVRAGLERCKRLGFGAVVVLGHPEYVPEDAFMTLELEPGHLGTSGGTIRYHQAFREL